MVDDFTGSRAYRGTEPFDSSDPPRYGQLLETTKDGIASEFRRFFDYDSDDMRAKIGEWPTIQKYAHMSGGTTTEKSMETVVNLIMAQADTPDRFPMIALTSASMKEKRLGIGGNIASTGQYSPSVTNTKTGPFDLQPGWTIEIETDPNGDGEMVTSTILFEEILFSDIHNATADDIVAAIGMQALYFHSAATSSGYFQIATGGPLAKGSANTVEITGGTAACLAELGLTVGQSASYLDTNNPPKQRFGVAADITINIDVVSDSLNTRTELADLVFDYFASYSERSYFQIMGRSYLDSEIDPPEWYQLILQGAFAWSGEYFQPRAGGDQREGIYSIRGSVPLLAVDFVNRDVGTYIQSGDVQQSEDLPEGDYALYHATDND